MAGYWGATAGTTLANPPVVIMQAISGHITNQSSGSTSVPTNLPAYSAGGKVWFYSSTNAFTDIVAVAEFFNDGPQIGMSNGDVLFGVYGTADTTKAIFYAGVLNCSIGSTSFALSSLGAFSATMATGV